MSIPMFDGAELLYRHVREGAVIHLDGDGLVVAGEKSPFELIGPPGGPPGGYSRRKSGYNAEGRAILAYLRGNPECPDAERARRILWERTQDYIERLVVRRADVVTSDRIREAPALIHEAEDAISRTWIAARTSAAEAAKFPGVLRAYRRAWKAWIEEAR